MKSDEITRLAFSIYENKGVYALLVGSGLSRAAEIPTGWEMTLDLLRRVALADGEDEQADWAAWYQAKYGVEPDYSELIGQLGLSRDERRSILHSYIEPTEEDRDEGRKLPTAGHKAIAELVRDGNVRVLITTNFDRLLENALRDQGVEPTVVASVDALKGAEPLSHSKCYLLKLHGDYKDARILNTEAELSAYPPEFDALLDRIFDEHGLVVCGWSGEWDDALRSAILRASARRYSMFWAARGKIGDQASKLIAQRAGQIVTIADADSFFSRVRDRVQTLQKTHRQNPRSVDLLVASTKRFLARSDTRIQLDDLFATETELLFEKLKASGYTNQGNWSADKFRDRVAVYEAATEPLARMAMVLGRWGDDTEAAMVLDILRDICTDADRDGSGLVQWINLRTYPAVLIVAAYGISLVRARRWQALHSFLSSEVPSRNEDVEKRVIDRLFLWAWPGGENEYWTKLGGYERRKTALSDHLAELFPAWGKSALGVLPDFEELYETWEILGSLAHFEKHDKAQLEPVLTNKQSRDFEFMPVGRSGWHQEMQRRIMARIEDGQLNNELLKAGFGKGDAGFLKLSITNFQRVAGRMAW